MSSLKDIFNVDLPIIQAPMAGAQGSAMTIAVSNAGGLGSLPCALFDNEKMRSELAIIKSQTTKPFNVNFFCHTQPVPNEQRSAIWRAKLQPYYEELNIPINEISSGPGRSAFNAEHAQILKEFKPPVVSFHFGLPSADLLANIKNWGIKIIVSATTVEEAIWLEKQGVDAIIAQGLEAGGHRGIFLSEDLTTQMGTFALLPQVVRSVNLPVIAAGGITDAKGIAAALSLGATGVQIGTAYLLCNESTITPLHRAALKAPSAKHTALTNIFTGRPARGIVNRLMKEIGPLNEAAPQFPLATNCISLLRIEAEKLGFSDFSPLWSGQNVSGCKEISAAELTKQLAQVS